MLIPLIVAKMIGRLQPSAGTWRCDDPSIRFDFKGDTVSDIVLISFLVFPVCFVVFFAELSNLPPHLNLIPMFKKAMLMTGSIYLRYWIVLTANILINMILKHLSAVPRNVIFNISNCLASKKNPENLDDIYDTWFSFPSGHAQLASFCAVFIIVYVDKRVGTKYSGLAKYWIQLVCLILAIFSCTSRITDHRHHILDVIVGAVVGSVMGVMTAREIPIDNDIHDMGGQVGDVNQQQNKPVKQKRPSKMRLLSSEFGSVIDTERELKEVNPNPAC